MQTGLWLYSLIHQSPCQVISEQTLWGQAVCRVWLPNQNEIACVPRSALQPLNPALNPEIESHRISYLASAAKVAEVLEGGANTSDGQILLAAMESRVIPLPHQIDALSRIISGDNIRYLLADEVGLGKTIEAGLVIRELKLRGLVRRILVVVPKGLTSQWENEMRIHFNETFQLILGEDLAALKRIKTDNQTHDWLQQHTSDNVPKINPWEMFNQVIVSLDSVKPMEKRRGWNQNKIDQYNSSRFEDLITAGWDLVIIDESHRLGGSTDQVARYKLGRGLAKASPYLLLLSATPHQGKSDAFHRLLTLLDDEAFPDSASVTRDRVAPFVIRTEKRKAIDADGKPLFKPRRTQMAAIQWQSRHHLQQLLYESVTDYVREGYNQALREKKQYIGFLMILMQRLVVSSTRAIRTTLERRLAVLKENHHHVNSRIEELENSVEITENIADLYDMDGQELLDELLKNQVSGLKIERSHVETLLDVACQCEQSSPDAKAEALLEWIYQLQTDENEIDLKVLIFTEFVPTQEMLKEFLETRGISVATLNGSMDMEQRQKAQDDFSEHIRVLVSTDAGGEGLNLQFCHVIINYDIPWNPMRLEQRIGRVDRIGQNKTVRAINFVFEESVEFRVREVLEQKLAVIFDEFGIDKTGDVLDSAQAGEFFEDMFAMALLNPDSIELSVDQTLTRIREEIRTVKESSAIYGISTEPDTKVAERLHSHPLPHWLEKMTISYLNAYGGKVNRKRLWWELTWPDGQIYKKCVFNSHEDSHLLDTKLLNLENSRIRELALNLPQIIPGQSIPCVSINSLPATINGLWGLFEIRIQAGIDKRTSLLRIPPIRKRYCSVFISEDGKLFLPTARHIWDILQSAEIDVIDAMTGHDAQAAFHSLADASEQAGQDVFNALQQEHIVAITKEEERGNVAFSARRKTIDYIGLAEVRQYRLGKCDIEEKNWHKELNAARQIMPEMRPLLLMKIIKSST